MSQQVQELIDKIKSEGIQTAEQKAKEIEASTKAKADQIIAGAEAKAQQLIVDAKEEIKKMQESTQMALKQGSRDTILSLRKEVENILHQVIAQEVSAALSAEALANILTVVVKDYLGSKDGDVQISLNDKDAKALKDGFLAKLQKQIKGEIKLQASGDVGRGFTISFDKGKSSFDFTDESLAQYLSNFLNAEIAALLKS